jgi:hypothetical protein
MKMVTHRGLVEDIGAPDKRGGFECRVGDVRVRVHPDLASSLTNGDDVYLAGKYRDKVLYVLAVNNLRSGKTAQVDATNQMLLIGLWGWVGIMSAAVLPMPVVSDSSAAWAILLLAAIIGVTFMSRSIRELILINRAANWVRHPDIK